jgi:hypothetical protein
MLALVVGLGVALALARRPPPVVVSQVEVVR